MNSLADILNSVPLWEKLQGFLDQGGSVLLIIMCTSFFLWLLIIERHYYFFKVHEHVKAKVAAQWQRRKDKQSWYAQKIRRQLLSLVRIQSEHNISTIKLVVVIAPLLGLLGTVTGMIDVFDVMATTGSGNTRGMAAGVSKATIPTMAGMVISLSGMLFSVSLQRRAKSSLESLSNHLMMEDET